jgi:hypothetical protein
LDEVQKTVEQIEQKSVQKTPEVAAVSCVIGGQKNQEVHGQANAVAHAHDKTLSEPDMIAMNEGETVARGLEECSSRNLYAKISPKRTKQYAEITTIIDYGRVSPARC